MKMTFTELDRLKNSGKIRGYSSVKELKPSGKIVTSGRWKKSPQKDFITAELLYFSTLNGYGLIEELVFDREKKRKFRFDWCIPDLMLAFEYEGITDHATKKGIFRDVEKYNLAQAQGWRVIRLNARNYTTVRSEIRKLINF
jgi:very-short-patch-repair endonuclease